MVPESKLSPSMIRRLCNLLWLALLPLGSCVADDQGLIPPPDALFFPTGVSISPDGRWAFVTNGNTDLRYSGGSMVAVDLDKAVGLINANLCRGHDPIDVRIPVCVQPEDAAYAANNVIDASKTITIGSFAGQPAVQRFLGPRSDATGRKLGNCRAIAAQPVCDPDDPHSCLLCPDGTAPAGGCPGGVAPVTYECIPRFDPDPAQGFRLLVPVRGDPSLTWINVGKTGVMDCGQGTAPGARCDTNHRITTLESEPSVVLSPEPFGVAVSEDLGIAVTAHLYQGTVGLFDVGDSVGTDPRLVDQRTLFSPNSSGARGAYGVAIRSIDPALVPPRCEGFPTCSLGDFTDIYVTSRFSDHADIAEVIARGADQCYPGFSDPAHNCTDTRQLAIVPSSQIPVDTFLVNGSDMRDIKFSADGNRAFIVDRSPPSLLIIDTTASPPPAGDPRAVFLAAVEVCSQPSLLAVREGAGPRRVYVSCFATGEIFVVDPDLAEVIDVIEVGTGPNAVTLVPTKSIVLPGDTAATPHLLGLVANFADNDLAVLDLEPGSRLENTVLFKIGTPHGVQRSH
jgi:hypothetical protein